RRRQLQAFRRAPQFLFRVFALGDVFSDSGHPIDMAVRVSDRNSAIPDPADGAVRPHYPILKAEATVLIRSDDRLHADAILGMYGIQKRVRILIKTFACPSPDPLIGRADVKNLAVIRD